MYAVIQTGGKQHRVQVGDVVKVERLAGEPGTAVVFDSVLMIGGDANARLGAPTLDGIRVRGTVVEQDRAQKVRIYHYKRRQNSNRKSGGHRQYYTAVKIEAIDI